MDISLTQFCAALISAFSFLVVVLVFMVGLIVTVDTLLHKSIVPAIGRIVGTAGKVWGRKKEVPSA